MHFDIDLREQNFFLQFENCSIKIFGGNWGVFEESFTNHMHSYYELHYVTGGQGTLITDVFDMPLWKGCFYLLPPRTNHEQWSNPEDYLQEYHLCIELLSHSGEDIIWESLLQNGYYATRLYNLEVYFDTIAKESTEKQYSYIDVIYQNLQSIFIVLIRSISTLKFRSRLSHAAMLLSTTKLSLDVICSQVGYKNFSFFSRSFKQQYHMTPVNYRKSHFHAINMPFPL